MDFLTQYWAEIALTLITAAGTITGLTASTKDDRIVDVLKRILQAIVIGKVR